MYAILLLLTTIVCCIMLTPDIQDSLASVPFCKSDDDLGLDLGVDLSGVVDVGNPVAFIDCKKGVGYQAVYRLYLILTLFFFLMSIIMINVKSSADPRAGIQNGFWGIKYLIIIASMIGAFWIPDGTFGEVWMYFGLTGGFLFILIQLVLIIDFAHR